jgi:hypothetical protein
MYLVEQQIWQASASRRKRFGVGVTEEHIYGELFDSQ